MELTVHGARLFAATGGRDWAAGQVSAILVHGAGMDHTVWAMQARALAYHGRNVLALDLPGHGRSAGPPATTIKEMADVVIAAADTAGLGSFRIAGHSMGALAALAVAAAAGTRVEALALVGFAPAMRVHHDLLAAATAGRHEALDMMVGWSLGTAGMLGANAAPGLSCAGVAMRLLERAPRLSLAADLAACEAYRDGETDAARVTAPTLLLLGGADRMTPVGPARALAAGMSTARTEVLEGFGHLLPLEAPGPTLAALSAIL